MRLRAIAARQRRDSAQQELAHTLTELAQIQARLASLRTSSATREARLARLLQLSEHEIDLLWTVVSATMDPTLVPHLVDLAGAEARHGISLALHAVIAELGGGHARAMALTLNRLHPLLRYGLMETTDGGLPAARPLTVPARVAAYLAGSDEVDGEVHRLGGVVRIEREPHYDTVQLEAVKRIARALAAKQRILVVIEGPREVGKRTAAALAALATNQQVIQIDVARLFGGDSDLERALVALRRECLLDGALPLIARVDDLNGLEGGEDRSRLRLLARFLDETPISAIVTSSVPGMDLGVEREVLRVSMPAPDTTTRRIMWEQALGGAPDVDIDLIASRYRVGAGAISRAVEAAKLLTNGSSLTTHTLVEGVRNGIAERLGGLAQRVEVRQTWDDLILNEDTLAQVKALIARVRYAHVVHEQWGFYEKLPRGLGTAALFSGAPGTGKTMVAGLIARELDLELYQVDLSKVVSKWVGETEKQLSKIFDAAEAGHALLLFDEADSLFAKRTEVKAAIDRYANLEVNYLLQRIESFGGISVLTTNMDTSIDPALRRRLAAHIAFDAPDASEREVLWSRLIATRAPTARTIDFEKLADEFPDMTGANIRNAVLAAAFLAASGGSPITEEHLRRAGRGEYRAMGRVIR
ncbi:MAG: ATP-binding protein [Myxococcales bacterium]|nr:ATP-binding protein [Myxococcales bacterium]